jgi:hypothetical protein
MTTDIGIKICKVNKRKMKLQREALIGAVLLVIFYDTVHHYVIDATDTGTVSNTGTGTESGL